MNSEFDAEFFSDLACLGKREDPDAINEKITKKFDFKSKTGSTPGNAKKQQQDSSKNGKRDKSNKKNKKGRKNKEKEEENQAFLEKPPEKRVWHIIGFDNKLEKFDFRFQNDVLVYCKLYYESGHS